MLICRCEIKREPVRFCLQRYRKFLNGARGGGVKNERRWRKGANGVGVGSVVVASSRLRSGLMSGLCLGYVRVMYRLCIGYVSVIVGS